VSERVLIVGAGQVGRGLFKAFRAAGIDVLGLHGRRASAWTTSSGTLPSAISDANTIVLAVRDNQIDDAIAELLNENQRGGRGRIASGTVIVHTSGGAEPELIPRLAEFGLSGGTFHPLVPFANPERLPELMKHAWIGIDGDDPARATSRRLAGHVGARTLDIPPGGKPLYHAAAVMSSNFPVVLAALAGDVLTSLGIPGKSAQHAVHGLMDAAVSNLAETSPVEALTGPIVRGETETLIRHLSALRRNAEARAVYKRLSISALEIAAERGVAPEIIEEMRRVLLLR
jgi:predicted short-subunit dehydrogenase-like oxidoreductase (DUF2520 family)